MRSLLSKNQIKFVRSLKQKKYRYKYKKYIIEGPRMISDLLNERPSLIDYIICSKDNKSILIPASVPVFELDPVAFGSLSEMVASQGIMAVCNIQETFFEKPERPAGFILYLDGIQDPGNVGTILRTAEFLSTDHVWIGPGTADPYNLKSVQSAMGSQAYLDIRQADPELVLQSELPVITADMDGENAFHFQWPENAILIMGNEGKGPSTILKANAAHVLTIPSGPGRRTESLNVGMACTSLLTLRMLQFQNS